jgi:hypothetical protein
MAKEAHSDFPSFSRRRPSRLGEEMARAKIERARRMTPEERLLLALELSDICLTLQRAGSGKP